MPGCGDIPEGLLGIENWQHFVNWVHMFYHSYGDRKQMGRCWGNLSKYPLTREMWQDLLFGQDAPDGL